MCAHRCQEKEAEIARLEEEKAKLENYLKKTLSSFKEKFLATFNNLKVCFVMISVNLSVNIWTCMYVQYISICVYVCVYGYCNSIYVYLFAYSLKIKHKPRKSNSSRRSWNPIVKPLVVKSGCCSPPCMRWAWRSWIETYKHNCWIAVIIRQRSFWIFKIV